MGGLLSEKFLDTNVSRPFAGPPLNTPSLQKYKRVSTLYCCGWTFDPFPFHITLILESVTDGRCLGWLELVPDFVANFKEGVIETWCSNRNCCCAIHTEPGIHHTSSWLEDFSCLHLYFCSIQQLMASVIMIPFFGFGADICCRFHGRCEIGTLRAHQRHQLHILTWTGWRGHEQHHWGIEEGQKFDGYYRGLWRRVQSLVVHAADWLI